MAYSTGSGDYVALMNAVLTHAIADGWSEVGGVGTGWPISKGNVRGVDWSTVTGTESDFTAGGDGLSKTQRYVYLGLGTDGADATTNAASPAPYVSNMAYTFTQWHIFSDPTLCDYIHVVAQFSNGVSSDCFTHFSFGEIDKGGLTYDSVAYATATARRGYAAGTNGGNGTQDNSGDDWNSLVYGNWMWAGAWGETDNGNANTAFMVNGTNAPIPNGVGGFPAWDTFHTGGAYVWGKNCRTEGYYPGQSAADDAGVGFAALKCKAATDVGQITMLPIIFLILNGTSNSSRARYLGVYPNVRLVRTEDVAPGEEFTFGSETWVVFPMTRDTDESLLNVRYQVTSGHYGFAYKKVT